MMFITTPLMVHHLGEQKYGVWLIALAIIGYLKFLDLGVSFAGTRFLGKAIGGKDNGELKLLLTKLFYLFNRIGIAVLVTSALLGVLIAGLAKSGSLLEGSHWIILGLGATTALRFWTRIYEVILKSHVRYDLIGVAAIVKTLLQGTLVIIFLSIGFGLNALLLIFIFTDLADQFLFIFFARRIESNVKFQIVRKRPPGILPLIRYSSSSMLTNLGSTLRNGIDPLIVGSTSGISFVPVYSIGARFLAVFADSINALFGGNLLAAFSQISGRNDRVSLVQSFFQSIRFSSCLATLGGTLLIILGPPFIERWIGPGFSDSGAVLLILTAPTTLMLAQYPIWGYFYSLNKQKWLTTIFLCGGGFNLLLSLLLSYFLGFFGVVIATAIELILSFGIIIPLLASRICTRTIFSYLLNVARPAMPIIFIACAFFILIKDYIFPSYPFIIVTAIVYLFIQLPNLWFIALTRSDRDKVKSAFRQNHE